MRSNPMRYAIEGEVTHPNMKPCDGSLEIEVFADYSRIKVGDWSIELTEHETNGLIDFFDKVSNA